MSKYIILYEHRDAIRKAIDAKGWKHSWYLPKDRHGYIDWNSPDTLRQCLQVLERYRDESIYFAAECAKLASLVGKKVGQIAAEEEEDILAERNQQ